MKFGIFYEHQLPRPWERESEYRLLQDSLDQTGRTSHEDICGSLELFAREVIPEFQAREDEHQRWKADVLAGRVGIEKLDPAGHTVYAHQNEDIVRLTPDELKRKMAAKDAAKAATGGEAQVR